MRLKSGLSCLCEEVRNMKLMIFDINRSVFELIFEWFTRPHTQLSSYLNLIYSLLAMNLLYFFSCTNLSLLKYKEKTFFFCKSFPE